LPPAVAGSGREILQCRIHSARISQRRGA
jgi:hypothetical protein